MCADCWLIGLKNLNLSGNGSFLQCCYWVTRSYLNHRPRPTPQKDVSNAFHKIKKRYAPPCISVFVVVSTSLSDTPEQAIDVDVVHAGVDGCGADGDNAGITGGPFEPPVVAPPAMGC
ncbi:hypothetical protein BYT27DRAFT_6893065 [Phlegmacium glaucopus]|nr:hypothetical protein BYT27DRAFT_6893065 [Phlegmacium glaucopus]